MGLEFARVYPGNYAAKLAFHKVSEQLKSNDHAMPYTRRFIHWIDDFEEESVYTDTDAGVETDTGEENDPMDPLPESMMFKGYFTLDLDVMPRNKHRGWRFGNGKTALRNITIEEVEFVATIDGKADHVHNEHCRLNLNWDSLVLLLTADKGRRVKVFSPNTQQLRESSIAIPYSNTSFQIGNLAYDVQFTGLSFGTMRKKLLEYRTELGVQMPAPPESIDPTPAPTDTFIKGYRLKEPDACGAFGMVYPGVDARTGDLVVVKRLAVKQNNELEVLTEIDMLEELQKWDSRHICRFKEAIWTEQGQDIREVYLVSLTFARETLRKVISSGDATNAERVFLFKDMLEGLVYMHERELMHRDLKPANIAVVTRSPARAMYIDFGHSTFDTESWDHWKGTIAYLAPEVLALKSCPMPSMKSPYTNKIDVWALGLCGYQLLLGKGLHWNTDSVGWRTGIRTVLDTSVRTDEELGPFCSVIMDMLRTDPGRRISAWDAVKQVETLVIRFLIKTQADEGHKNTEDGGTRKKRKQ